MFQIRKQKGKKATPSVLSSPLVQELDSLIFDQINQT